MRFLENELSRDIWEKKYRYNGETVDEWFNRASGGNKDIERLLREGKFLFGGRILSNRGLAEKGKKVTYSNCYVLSTGDSIEEIYKTHSDLARTFSAGGGVGIDVSPLRPKGANVNNAAKTTSGAVSFMPSFSQVAEIIAQNGRRGALMISMRCDHPDIEEFIDCKTNSDAVTKANISVRITDDFMEAVTNKEDYKCRFTLDDGEEIVKTINAYELFKKLCKNNWDWAEPGILYWDRVENYNLLQYDDEFKYAGVNPCAEEPLPDGGSCLLGSINLSAYVDGNVFRYKYFRNDIKTIVRAMNEVLDEGLPYHPLEIQRETVRDYRQIGIGVMGIADMLIKLGLEYGSQDSLVICDSIGFVLAQESIKESIELAKRDGAYPKYKGEVLDSQFFRNHATDEMINEAEKYGLRNSQLLTIAPTGSISTMLGISGGIEPIFANYYMRKTESLHGEDKYYKVYTPIVKDYMDKNKIEDDKDLPNYFVTAQNLEPFRRIDMQSIWQRHIDASISSTINLVNETTQEEVEEIYMRAWEKGLKGLTIYRDGCKRSGVLTVDKKEEKLEEDELVKITQDGEILIKQALRRGQVEDIDIEDCIAKGRRLVTGCGTLWVTAYFDKKEGNLKHIFLDKGSKGGCNSFMCGLSRLISLATRTGASIEDIVDQLESTVTCNSYYGRTLTKKDTSKGGSCPSAIGTALKSMYKEIQEELRQCGNNIDKMYIVDNVDKIVNNPCPNCGNELMSTQGCWSCTCGYSKCDL